MFNKKLCEKFGNKFEYLNEYVSCHSLLKIKCIQHDIIFEVSARNHLRSDSGSCPECKKNNLKELKSPEENYFIKKSTNIYGDRFNYSKVSYKNSKEPITLICNKHNYEFNIEPKSHYHSKSGGCIYCNNELKNKELVNILINKYFNFDFTLIDLTKTKYTIQEIKCNVCNNNIKICIDKFDGICSICEKNKKQKILDIGEKIKNTISMRLNFKNDEYIKRINIEGFDEYYISNYGNIFNKNKTKLEGHTNLQGYVFVRLNFNNKNTLFRLHRLVCEIFNGNPPENKNIVDHINRVRNDNRAINLRWVSQKENTLNKSNTINNDKKNNIIEKYMKLDKPDEIFKIIKNSIYNFENYSVSNYGKILNNKTNKLLKPTLTDEGYLITQLINYKDKDRKKFFIHRLVCEFFNNKLNNDDIVVNHINEIKYDNYYKNLEWVNIKKNNQHSKNIKINMLDDNKNIVKTFSSYTEAHIYINNKNT